MIAVCEKPASLIIFLRAAVISPRSMMLWKSPVVSSAEARYSCIPERSSSTMPWPNSAATLSSSVESTKPDRLGQCTYAARCRRRQTTARPVVFFGVSRDDTSCAATR
jgi:hypothetical protein